MEELLAKYFTEEATEEECKQVEEWRNTSKENSEAFFSYKNVWASTTPVKPGTDIDELLSEAGSKTETIPLWRKSWFRYAASIILVVGVTLALYYGQDQIFSNTGALAREVRLDDGTVVTLYKDATLEEITMEQERKVRIKGKAFFDVKENKNKPFIILTPEAMIRVLGTSFLVNSSVEYTTEVVVESGLVSFAPNPENNKGITTSIKLSKGEKGIISPRARGIVKQNNRDENYLAWKTQILTFKEKDLAYVGSVIEEVYGYQVKFSNQDLKTCKLTAKFNRKPPQDIAKLISETFGLEFVIKETKIIEFSGPACK